MKKWLSKKQNKFNLYLIVLSIITSCSFIYNIKFWLASGWLLLVPITAALSTIIAIILNNIKPKQNGRT